MDNIAREDLHSWLSEHGFIGSLETLQRHLFSLEFESRCRLCWSIWRSRFRSNQRAIKTLETIQSLGLKHFEHHMVSADHILLGSMEFSKPRPDYAHSKFKAVSVHLEWRDHYKMDTLLIRLIFRYKDSDDIRDKYLEFKVS